MRDTIDMAREAGFFEDGGNVYGDLTSLKDFEALVRADTLANIDPSKFMSYQEAYEAGQVDEREACAKVCEQYKGYGGNLFAPAIRARGETK